MSEEQMARAENEYERLKDKVHDQYEEIKRYKNIIDELEKDLNILIEDNGISPNSKNDFKYILQKLKELKGE